MSELDLIHEVVDETLKNMGLDKSKDYKETKDLISLKSLVSLARKQLVSMQPKISDGYLPTAKSELSEVIKASDESMMSVLDCASTLDEIEADLPEETAKKLREVVTNIYNSSVNHDVMVQRINKVNDILDSIDYDLSEVTNSPGNANKRAPRKKKDPLKQGPQSEGEAPSQDDIDSLFG